MPRRHRKRQEIVLLDLLHQVGAVEIQSVAALGALSQAAKLQAAVRGRLDTPRTGPLRLLRVRRLVPRWKNVRGRENVTIRPRQA
jgi:hypothetical protein